MKKNYFFALCMASNLLAAQYDGAAGTPGSKAISADSSQFVAWATGAFVTRGLQDIANDNGNKATVGNENSVLGKADGSNVVSLGDGGHAVVTFAKPISNGAGADFAVFENSFNDTFLELAFVEVSSDGVNFFRFPAVSNTQTATQVGSFGSVDPTKLYNLAGKYKSLYGTPFNLDDIKDDPLLNKNAVTHVKIIDVVGTINPAFARYDSLGQIVNDPYPTPFASSGFDLDAVGVIHQSESLSVSNHSKKTLAIFPNPAKDFVKTNVEKGKFKIITLEGALLNSSTFTDGRIDLKGIQNGIYLIQINDEKPAKLIISKE